MNLMDWLGQHPEFSQRFDQFMANHPNVNPQPRMPMQFQGMTGGNTPAMQFPMAQTGGGLPPVQMPQQRMPMRPMTGGPMNPQPTDGGYDGSGINPGGMYTGGNTPPVQRFPTNRLNPRRGGLAGMFAQYA